MGGIRTVDIPAGRLVEPLAVSAGLGPVERITPLDGGSNNRVFRLDARRGTALLKAYHRDPADARDRLAAEFGFCRFAWGAGVRAVPEPLAQDPEGGLALYEFIRGRAPTPKDATPARVAEAFAFFEALNRSREAAGALPDASEACFSVAAHVERVGKRVESLSKLAGGSKTTKEAARFAAGPLTEAFARAGGRALALPEAAGELPREDRRISPSDFGFHNALLQEDGKLRFIDFEYAGWDDPAKLVCDFFCQPAVPASRELFAPVAQRVSGELSDPAFSYVRMFALWPLYQVKWCCILLNDFLPEGSRRRRFAGAEGGEKALAAQLEKAKAALARLGRA